MTIVRDTLWWFDPATPGGGHPVVDAVSPEAAALYPFLAWSPDGRRLVIRTDGQPVILDRDDPTAVVPLIPDTLREHLATFKAYLAGGPAWSPDGTAIAFLAADRRDPAFLLQAWVFHRLTGRLEQVSAATEDVMAVAWSPDGRTLLTSHGRLGGSTARLQLQSVGDGWRVVSDTVVEGEMLFRSPLWHPAGSEILVGGIRRGWQRFVVGDGRLRDGGPTRVTGAIAWMPAGDSLVALRPRGSMGNQLVVLGSDGGGGRPVSRMKDGVERFAGFVGTEVAFTHQSGAHSLTLNVGDATIRTAADGANAGQDRHRSRIVTWRVDSSGPLSAQVLVPPRPRGVLVAPYGGYRDTSLDGDYFFDRLLARALEHGWAIVRPNTRGIGSEPPSGRYGALQLGDTEALLDSLTGTGEELAGLPVAVMGHSHGGAMAYYYATHSTRFCSAVAINGRADWIMQAHHPMDGVLPGALGATPEEDPERYRLHSPAANAAAAVPILAIAGDEDTQILPANARTMVDSMVVHGRPAELIELPGIGHLIPAGATFDTVAEAIDQFRERHCR